MIKNTENWRKNTGGKGSFKKIICWGWEDGSVLKVVASKAAHWSREHLLFVCRGSGMPSPHVQVSKINCKGNFLNSLSVLKYLLVGKFKIRIIF